MKRGTITSSRSPTRGRARACSSARRSPRRGRGSNSTPIAMGRQWHGLVAAQDTAENGAVAPAGGLLRRDGGDRVLPIVDPCGECANRVAHGPTVRVEHALRSERENGAKAFDDAIRIFALV